MTLVGTLKANKKEVPKQTREKANHRLGSSAFLFTNEMTMDGVIRPNNGEDNEEFGVSVVVHAHTANPGDNWQA